MFDYETLRIIWWALLGILLIGFAIMDGFDLGSMALLPFVARDDMERRIAINTIGPVWEGNQVWFILGGGAIFAAWPQLYATSFSGFYLAMFLVLAALILRPAAIKYRSKGEGMLWRSTWDTALFVSGVVPSLVFGVAFGNLFCGVPFTFDTDLRLQSDISLLGLLNPFSLLVGLVSLTMLMLHGAAWLNLKTEGKVQARAAALMPYLALGFAVLFALAGLWVSQMDGHRITGALVTGGPSNPLAKTVDLVKGGWLANFAAYPALWAFVVIAYFGAGIAVLTRQLPVLSFFATALIPLGTIATAGVALFPFLLPSSSHPGAGLTVWDASSSKLTLAIMLGAVALFLPIVGAYTAWAYTVLRGKVTAETISADSKTSY